jgi:hypothetical protein
MHGEGATGTEEKQRRKEQEASSTRSSGRKSGYLAEVARSKGVALVSCFPNPGCANEEFWKFGREQSQVAPAFPRLPQKAKKALCKAGDLC